MQEELAKNSSNPFSPTGFRELISGRRRGATAVAMRGMLALAELPYTWIVRRRNARYDSGANHVHRANVPVISVGNLTLGGTGKSPMVEWVVRELNQRKKVGIISRGYRAKDGLNDEALELAWKLPGVPHIQNPDRLAAARRAIGEFGCEVLVLDDAFQHRRLARDLDIVLLDALEPFGFERVFPRGTLREPVEGLSRAHVIALSRADLITAEERSSLRGRVATISPSATWIEVVHAPVELVAYRDVNNPCESPAPRQPLEHLRRQRVLAFCGLGNPAGFRHTLTTCGYEIVGFQEFPDHYHYGQADLDGLDAEAQRRNVAAIVCTQKDLVKIRRGRLGDRPLWAVQVGIEFISGRQALQDRLMSAVTSHHFSRIVA
jgi:tetraacyldisaccharide 4'-kinase